MQRLPERKPTRIKDYDYSTPGAYFITICVANRKPILWNVGAATCRPQTNNKNGRLIAAPTIFTTFSCFRNPAYRMQCPI